MTKSGIDRLYALADQTYWMMRGYTDSLLRGQREPELIPKAEALCQAWMDFRDKVVEAEKANPGSTQTEMADLTARTEGFLDQKYEAANQPQTLTQTLH